MDSSLNLALSSHPARSGRPARLVFLLQDLEFGGTQRQVLELARRLDPARYRPEIWLLWGGDDLAPLARDWGLPLVWLSRRKRLVPIASLLSHLFQGDIDLLLPFTVVPNIWGRLLGRLARVPAIVGNCRGGGAPQRQYERWLWPLTQQIVCNSASLQRELTGQYGVPAARVRVILNGVDTSYFQPSPDGVRPYPAVVLSMARMVPDKDHETLVRAFAMVAPEFPRAQLWLVGEGPLMAKVQRLAGELLAADACRIIPPQADVRPIFREAGLLALSSRTEALPNVVLEAMAAGLPVAATAVGGVPELVNPGRTGWLAPPEDPQALAAVLRRLLADPEQCRAFGQAGRLRAVQEFSLDAMVSRYEEVLGAVLHR